jgi:hypothetical protein
MRGMMQRKILEHKRSKSALVNGSISMGLAVLKNYDRLPVTKS